MPRDSVRQPRAAALQEGCGRDLLRHRGCRGQQRLRPPAGGKRACPFDGEELDKDVAAEAAAVQELAAHRTGRAGFAHPRPPPPPPTPALPLFLVSAIPGAVVLAICA